MNISEASNRGQVGALIGDKGRREEVKRLAQGVAAEHFGVGQQQPQNGNSAFVDTAKISDEAIEEISKSGKANEMERTDQLVSALRDAFAMQAPQDQQQQQQQGQAQGDGSGEAGAVGGVEGANSNKKLEKKRTTHWEPAAEAGQIHPEGREVIGKITIKEEVKEVDDPKAAAKNTGGGAGGGQSGGAGAPQAGSPPTGNASGVPSVVGGVGKGQSSGNAAAQGDQKSRQKMDEDGKADKEAAAASQSLQKSGLQAPGMEQGAENYEVGEKTKDFDVRSPATGASQTLTMREAGELKGGDNVLGTYKKLDDSPALRYASLHSRGEGLENSAKRYAQEAQTNGESADQVVKNVEQLKKTTADG